VHRSARQSIELFHLVLLRALVGKGEDKALIALKGGANLRFFFGSIRYSEDIDFDVVVIAKETLRKRVERLLMSPLVAAPLKARGMEVTDVSAPKQTDTTQRWKVGLRVDGLSVPLRTKIEFSRRDAIEGTAFEAIDAELLRACGLMPSLATHYKTHAAIGQKVRALAGRTEPQARDVFDLSVLFSRSDSAGFERAMAGVEVGPAIEQAMAISFEEYRAKVVAYLAPDQAEPFESQAAWNAMQEAVISRLEGSR